MLEVKGADKVASQLEEFKKEVERKLKGMVAAFAVDVVGAASDFSPLGNAIKYEKFYLARQKAYGWKPEEGMAKGGWTIGSTTSIPFIERHTPDPTGQAVAGAWSEMQDYKLGESFGIGTAVPYVSLYADEIVAPTRDMIKNVIEADLKDYYQSA
jgi:hypothetical protein